MSATPFFGGVPTAPDVQRLIDKLGVPAVGTLITYDELSAILHEDPDSSRFGTVIAAWRKRLDREHNVILEASPSKGYVVLDPKGRVAQSSNRLKSGMRKVRRAADVALRTDVATLTDDEKRARDCVINVGSQTQLAAATESRRLRISLPESKPAAAKKE